VVGWDGRWEECAAALAPPGSDRARVVQTNGARCIVHGPQGRRSIDGHGLVVGDWVLLDDGRPILLERRTALTRKSAGRTSSETTLAVNMDVVLVAEPLDPTPKLGRIERMLTLVRSSGAAPVVVLTKYDRGSDVDVEEVRKVAVGVPVVAISAATGENLDALRRELSDARTFVVVGPSGAGKSTLVNTLAGTSLVTAQTRADGRGRHTTSRSELVVLPGTGVLIDTPGIRSIGMPSAIDLDMTFADLVELAPLCRFADCSHRHEPGCALIQAVDSGAVEARRLRSFLDLSEESERQSARAASRRSTERFETRRRERTRREIMRLKGRD
jgi:ribosome biogenesis GTPase / thiamine phosphate phosphatase